MELEWNGKKWKNKLTFQSPYGDFGNGTVNNEQLIKIKNPSFQSPYGDFGTLTI